MEKQNKCLSGLIVVVRSIGEIVQNNKTQMSVRKIDTKCVVFFALYTVLV